MKRQSKKYRDLQKAVKAVDVLNKMHAKYPGIVPEIDINTAVALEISRDDEKKK